MWSVLSWFQRSTRNGDGTYPTSRDLSPFGGDPAHVLHPEGIEALGCRFVVGHRRVDVGVGEAEDTHVGESLLDLVAPQADVTQDRHDAHEQEPAECALQLARVDIRRHLSREAERLPDLFAEEAVSHAVAGVDTELFSLVTLGLGQLRVVIAQ